MSKNNQELISKSVTDIVSNVKTYVDNIKSNYFEMCLYLGKIKEGKDKTLWKDAKEELINQNILGKSQINSYALIGSNTFVQKNIKFLPNSHSAVDYLEKKLRERKDDKNFKTWLQIMMKKNNLIHYTKSAVEKLVKEYENKDTVRNTIQIKQQKDTKPLKENFEKSITISLNRFDFGVKSNEILNAYKKLKTIFPNAEIDTHGKMTGLITEKGEL